MTYPEVLANARECIGKYCKACPVCNGVACKNQIPGPGAKGVGDTAIRNYNKWAEIRVNMDTLCEGGTPDTHIELFGKSFKYPFFAGPVGAVNLHYSEAYTDMTYNDVLVRACAENGIAAFTGDGTNPDAEDACAKYNQIIHAVGGIDLQLLGIGHDGHIGFNEPGEAFELETHCVDLTPETIEANKRFFDGNVDLVPKQAYTMGIKTIMQARKVLMVANGKGKAEIVKKAFFGPVTPEVPASILQMHPDFTLVGDEEALSLI